MMAIDPHESFGENRRGSRRPRAAGSCGRVEAVQEGHRDAAAGREGGEEETAALGPCGRQGPSVMQERPSQRSCTCKEQETSKADRSDPSAGPQAKAER